MAFALAAPFEAPRSPTCAPYLGSIEGDRLACFQSPVAGVPPVLGSGETYAGQATPLSSPLQEDRVALKAGTGWDNKEG